MTSAIGGTTLSPPVQAANKPPQQVQASGRDSDGDNDGSRPGEVETAKATSGSVGTIINTKA